MDGQSLLLPEEYLQSNVAASALLGISPSLDGESLLLPDDDSGTREDDGLASYMNMLSDPSGDNASVDFQDDVSSSVSTLSVPTTGTHRRAAQGVTKVVTTWLVTSRGASTCAVHN